jgi:diguanylate cyclase (GGDEF)-like protein/PAS domain S-box-containing protein
MGSTVTIEPAVTTAPGRVPSGPRPAAGALRVLVIDDSPADAALVSAALRRDRSTRFTVDKATTIASGCARVAQLWPDCVLLDLGLPDTVGLEGVEQVTAAAPTVPVVVVTGWDDTDTALAAIAAGAQDYLVKGRMDVEVIGRVIRYSVSRKQAEAELVRQERDLRESEDRYRTLMELLDEGVVLEDRGGRVLTANPSAARILGTEAPGLRDLPGPLWRDDETPWDPDALPWVDALRRGRPVDRQIVGVDRTDGSRVWLSLNSRPLCQPDEHEPHGVVTSFTDVTEARASERLLREQALHDSLTGLPNRTQLLSRIERSLRRVDRDGDSLGLLYLDLDGFKVVNDSMGHEAGDDLLCQVARRLEATVRPSDTVARLGGDEFVVVCDHLAGDEAAEQVADRVAESFLVPFPLAGGDVMVGASVGWAVSGPGTTAADLLRRADEVMFECKRSHR